MRKAARPASLVEKIMRAADGPGTGLAPRTQCCGPSGLVQKVEKIMRAADGPGTGLAPRTQCCGPSGLVQKIKKMMHAAAEADEPDEANREAWDESDAKKILGKKCSKNTDCCDEEKGFCTLGCRNDKCSLRSLQKYRLLRRGKRILHSWLPQ